MSGCGFLLAGKPGVEVRAANADLVVRELYDPGPLAAGSHAIEGGTRHVQFVENFGELEHLRAGHRCVSFEAGCARLCAYAA